MGDKRNNSADEAPQRSGAAGRVEVAATVAVELPVEERDAPNGGARAVSAAWGDPGSGSVPVVGSAAPPPPPPSGDARRILSSWEDIPELLAHLAAARTFGFSPAVTITGDEGVGWVSPLIDPPLEFPHMWIKGAREARFLASRQRIRKLLDRLCGLTADQPPPKTIVLVAHPDDEAIGAGARLRDLPDVDVAYVTDGAPRDPEYALRKGYATCEAYAKSRQAELAAALALVGVPPERTKCLGIGDGEAAGRLVEVTYLIAEMLDELRPEVVLTHPYEGGHTDHDATAFAVHLACGMLRRDGVPAPIVLELTSYHYHHGRRRTGEFLPHYGVEERTIELEAGLQVLKQEMYDCFVSQQKCLAEFGVGQERFRAAPRYVFTVPPHGGPLLYEMAKALDGSAWRARAARALERIRSSKRVVAAGD